MYLRKVNFGKIFTILLLFIFIFSKDIFAYSLLTSNKPTYGSTTTKVNFRSIASTSSGVIKVLESGTKVKMVGVIDKFYIVQLATNEVGVVSKDYIKPGTVSPAGASVYTMMYPANATTSTTSVYLRRGPSTSFAKVTLIASPKTTFKVIGYINDFYVVVLSNNTVGMIRKDLVKLSAANTVNNANTSTGTSESKTIGDQSEELVLKLINKARNEAGLSSLKMGSTLLKIARLKAADMVSKSYFSHTSPTYGSPFDMMRSYSINYISAGENIAGNPSLEDAVKAWLNSPTHRENILSNKFNYVGIGIDKSPIYGNIIVAMFAEV